MLAIHNHDHPWQYFAQPRRENIQDSCERTFWLFRSKLEIVSSKILLSNNNFKILLPPFNKTPRHGFVAWNNNVCFTRLPLDYAENLSSPNTNWHASHAWPTMEFSQLAREQLPCSLRRTVEAGGHFECLCNTSMASTHPQPIGVHICKILPITTSVTQREFHCSNWILLLETSLKTYFHF